MLRLNPGNSSSPSHHSHCLPGLGLDLGEGRQGERENIDVREEHWSVASHRRPNRGSNRQPFGCARKMLQPDQPGGQGLPAASPPTPLRAPPQRTCAAASLGEDRPRPRLPPVSLGAPWGPTRTHTSKRAGDSFPPPPATFFGPVQKKYARSVQCLINALHFQFPDRDAHIWC